MKKPTATAARYLALMKKFDQLNISDIFPGLTPAEINVSI
jgi:hypothetical protein